MTEHVQESPRPRVVLVTGASSGFGRATALALAHRGDHVFAGIRQPQGRNAEAAAGLRRAAAGVAGSLETVGLDVDQDDSVQTCVAEVLARAGGIDALVNNAGFGVVGPWEHATIDDVKRQFETNVFGVFRMSQAVVPAMREQRRGWIVSLSSHAAVRPQFFEGIYAASKFALEGMSMVMRWELQQFGIRVCVINAGWYATGFVASQTTTTDLAHPSGPYRELVERFGEMRRAKGTPSTNLEEVAARVAEVLDLDDPPFRNPVGTNPLRMANVPIEEFERNLFAYFEMERFRGPWAT